jgi:hypothetical protein
MPGPAGQPTTLGGHAANGRADRRQIERAPHQVAAIGCGDLEAPLPLAGAGGIRGTCSGSTSRRNGRVR